MTLADAPFRVPLSLGRAEVPSTDLVRLAELGLRPGATVTLIRRTAGGGRIVSVGPARVALGNGLLTKIPASVSARALS